MDGNKLGHSQHLLRKALLRLKSTGKPTRWLIFLLALLGTELAAVGLICYNLQDRGPSPDKLLDGSYFGSHTFDEMGSNAVPFLINKIEDRPSSLGRLGDKVDKKFHVPERVAERLPSAERVASRRSKAAYLIASMGPKAKAAIPALLRVFGDPSENSEMHFAANNALKAMGETLSPYTTNFIPLLNDTNRLLQLLTVEILAGIGPKGKAAVPALLQVATNQTGGLAAASAFALWKIDGQTNLALRVFTNALQDPSPATQQAVVKWLGEMGSAAKSAGPIIQPLLLSSESYVRQEAEKALGLIDPPLLRSAVDTINANPAAEVQKIIQTIPAGKPRDVMRALEALRVFDTNAAPAVPVLIQLVSPTPTNSPPTAQNSTARLQMNSRTYAVDVLAEIGPSASAAVPALVALLPENQEMDSRLLISVCQALGKIGPAAVRAMPALTALQKSKRRDTELIKRMRERYGVPVMDDDPGFAIVAALARIDPQNSSNYLASFVTNNPLPWSTRVALWKFGGQKEPPVELLTAILKNDWPQESKVALLGEIGPAARSALPQLKLLLQGNNPIALRRATAIAIRKIGPAEADKLGLPGLLALP